MKLLLIIISERIATKKLIASTKKSDVIGIILINNPARMGPPIVVTEILVWIRAFAASSESLETNAGIAEN
ncbi:hypothetical protein KDAU_64440 [Dictyobacter aurantiacus]|uniref:Uncharacterized protein n=1 Tax=Dictyobacter aurantiacus TaxID=1936993 RepID=A0A401ZQH1_9CHLR|nr:hypothetical protein KDAU_64440 [Dictyobacter aurantiacus]